MDELQKLKPLNHGQLPEFNYLVRELFVPLNQISHDKTNRASKTFAKEQVIKRFISQWRQHVGDDIYPAVISILAQRDRTMYNMKEDRFISILSKVAHIKKGSDDWNSLKQWKRSNQNKVQAERSFEDIAAGIVMVKGLCLFGKEGTLSLSDFNDYLQKLASSVDKEKVPLIKELCGKLSYDEVRFFFRILMKRNPMGGMEKCFLYNWNPDMLKLINLTNNLKYAFWKLSVKDKRLPDYERIVQLMKPFTPQRSERVRKSYDDIAAMFSNNFFVEEKYDGERFQLHMERQPDDTIKYKYFTRNANEFSFLYGETSESTGCISPFISDAFRPGLKSCVLDGEMISYDPVREKTLPFSTVKSTALDMLAKQKTEIETTECYPMFVVFDVLYCNGISVENKPLVDRKKLLSGIIVNPVPNRFEIAGFKICTQGKEIQEALSLAIKMDSEGIMIKDPNSKYNVGTVSKDWVKVKPEYLEEFGENLDLIIVGKAPAMKTTYVCALRNYVKEVDVNMDDEELNEQTENTYNDAENRIEENQAFLTDDDCKFITLCRVANGFSAEDYKKIESLTAGKWTSTANKLPSEELIKFGTHLPESWIDPRNSVVIEVKSRSVDPETKVHHFGVGTTLINAYCVKIRDDKDWKVASTLQEFNEKTAFHKHKVAPHTVAGVKRKKHRLTQKEYYQEKLNAAIPVNSSFKSILFEYLTFYVLSDYVDEHKRYSKTDLMRMIKSHGGSITAAVKNSSDHKEQLIVLSQKSTREVIELANIGYDILSFSWIFDCIRVNQVIPVEPSHCLNVSHLKRAMASFAVDRYGDSYTCPVTKDTLNQTIERMPGVPTSNSPDFLEFGSLFRLFENIKFYLIDTEEKQENLLAARIKIYSGTLTNSIKECSFVVVSHYDDPEDRLKLSPKLQELRTQISNFKTKIPRFVTSKFVEKSIEEGILVDAVAYKVY